MIYGVCTHIGTANQVNAMAAINNLGVQSVRDDFSWASIEATQGVFSFVPGHLSKLAAYESVGNNNVGLLAYGNPLYGVSQPYTQAERDKFCDYVRWLVPQIKHTCKYFEVWNEWHIGHSGTAEQKAFTIQQKVDGYLALIRDVYPIVKELAPESIVLGMSIAWIETAYIQAAFDAGTLSYCDAVAIHTYDDVNATGKPEVIVSRLDAAQTLMTAENGGVPVDLYITEMGFATHTLGHPAAIAAGYMARLYRLFEIRPWVKGMWWYDLWDDGADQANKEHRFGLFANDAVTKKPASHAYRALTHRTRHDQYGWCRVAVTAAVETTINGTSLPARAKRALSNLRSTNTTVTIGARTLNVMTGPIDLAVLDDIGERFADDFIITEGPVVRGQVPAQTTATRTTTWPNGWG